MPLTAFTTPSTVKNFVSRPLTSRSTVGPHVDGATQVRRRVSGRFKGQYPRWVCHQDLVHRGFVKAGLAQLGNEVAQQMVIPGAAFDLELAHAATISGQQ